jgi:hypothetical protein
VPTIDQTTSYVVDDTRVDDLLADLDQALARAAWRPAPR